jgi:hypothetical protein
MYRLLNTLTVPPVNMRTIRLPYLPLEKRHARLACPLEGLADHATGGNPCRMLPHDGSP